MPRVTATEASRSFSELLNRVAAGERIEIVRNGAPVAVIGPPLRTRLMSAARFREFIASLPPVDEDFAADLRAIRKSVDVPDSPWPS